LAGAARELESAGHDVATVAGQSLAGWPETRLIEWCRDEQRALVTLDLDFANPLIFDPQRYLGIAVPRLPRKPQPTELYDAAETLIGALQTRSISLALDRGASAHPRVPAGEEDLDLG